MCEQPIISLQSARPHNTPFLRLSDPASAWSHLIICSLSNISKAILFERHFWFQYRYVLSEYQWATGPQVSFRGGLHFGVFGGSAVLCNSGSHHPDRPGSANQGPRARSRPPPAFRNYTWLEHSHIIYLCMIYDSFQAAMAEFSSCNQNHTAPKQRIFITWPFIEKVCQPLIRAWCR